MGILLILGGIGLFMGQGWARWFGIFLTFVNALAQIAFLAAYPIWSTIVIALNVFVIFGADRALGRGPGRAARGVGNSRRLTRNE